MKKLLITLFTTFYLLDGSYIWKAPNAWDYWTYKQEHWAGQGMGSYHYDTYVPIGVKFWHEGTVWRIPFSNIVKITDE